MSKPVWEEAIEAESQRIENQFMLHTPTDCPLEGKCKLCSHLHGRTQAGISILSEIKSQLRKNPPPIVEAFAWTDSYGELQVKLKAVSPAETFPSSRPDKKRRYWLIEIPAKEIRKHCGPLVGDLNDQDVHPDAPRPGEDCLECGKEVHGDLFCGVACESAAKEEGDDE